MELHSSRFAFQSGQLVLQPWATHSTLLSLNFCIHKMQIIIVLMPKFFFFFPPRINKMVLVKHSAWRTASSQYLEVIIIITMKLLGSSFGQIFEILILLKLPTIRLCQLDYADEIFLRGKHARRTQVLPAIACGAEGHAKIKKPEPPSSQLSSSLFVHKMLMKSIL